MSKQKESLSISMAKAIMVVAIIVSLGAVLGILGYALTKQKCAVQNPPVVKETNETAKLTLEEIKNAEYYLSAYAKKIRLKDGRYYEEPDPLITSFGTEISVDKIAMGDLNNDGKEDAAVILRSYYTGGSISNYDLSILINKNGKPDYLTYKYLGYGVVINSIDIHSGEIILDMVIHDSDDMPFWPTVAKVLKYRLSGNTIEEVDETADWKTYRNEEYGFEIK